MPNFPLPLYLFSPLSYILPTCSQMLIFNLLTSLCFNTPTTFLFAPPFPSMTFQLILTPSSPPPPPPPPPIFAFCFIYVYSPATSILTHPYPLHVIVLLCSLPPIPPAPH